MVGMLNLDLHCLQSSLSKYDVAWVNFLFFYLFENLQT